MKTITATRRTRTRHKPETGVRMKDDREEPPTGIKDAKG